MHKDKQEFPNGGKLFVDHLSEVKARQCIWHLWPMYVGWAAGKWNQGVKDNLLQEKPWASDQGG